MTSLKNLKADLNEVKMDVLSASELSNLKGGCGSYYGGGKSGKNNYGGGKSGKNNYGGGKSGKNNYGGGYGSCCSCYCHG